MSTGKTNLTSTQFSAKKLLGKAHTSNLFSDVNESLPSSVQAPSQIIFGQDIPNSPVRTEYLIQSASAGKPGTIEYVHFEVTSLSNTIYDANVSGGGGDEGSSSGAHGYYLKLPSDYEASSNNPLTGSGFYNDSERLYNTRGKLQIVPPFISNASPNNYFLKLWKGDPSNPANEITSGDSIDWQIDYYSGVIFIQDYSGGAVPLYASGFLYIGKFTDEVLNDVVAQAAGAALTVKEEGSNLTIAASSMDFAGNGVVASSVGNNVTVTVNNSVTDLKQKAENRLVTIGATTSELEGESNLTFDGNQLDLSGSMNISGSILPIGNRTHNLGSPDKHWANVYTGDLHLQNERGNWTIIEEEDYLSLRNNKTGKLYKFVLSEIT